MHGIPGATEQSTSALDLAGTTYREGNETAKIGLTYLDTIITNRTGPPLGGLVVCIIQVVSDIGRDPLADRWVLSKVVESWSNQNLPASFLSNAAVALLTLIEADGT